MKIGVLGRRDAPRICNANLGRATTKFVISPALALETSEGILEELSKFRPDVVHCHSFYGNLPYEFLPIVSKRYPTCFTVHDPRPIGTMGSGLLEL